MKYIFCLLSGFIFFMNTHAQCKSGDCNNGTGKYDFGWCVYEGAFKNGKPEGKGTMTYDDYTYKGNFTNGVEDGQGVITYKNGRMEDVTYWQGKKMKALEKVAKEDWKELEGFDGNCLSGNCKNGYGTYKFVSGNRYTGNFVNGKREGEGTFYFADGDVFTGTFKNNEKYYGTYTFKSSGSKYTGSYDSEGRELDGNMVGPGGYSIPFVKGNAIIPANATISKTSLAAARETHTPHPQQAEKPTVICNACHGSGKIYESYYGYATGAEKRYGVTAYRTGYSRCSACGGTGSVKFR